MWKTCFVQKGFAHRIAKSGPAPGRCYFRGMRICFVICWRHKGVVKILLDAVPQIAPATLEIETNMQTLLQERWHLVKVLHSPHTS